MIGLVVAPSSFDSGIDRAEEREEHKRRETYIYLSNIGRWMDGCMDRDVDTKEDGSERNVKYQVRRV